MAEDIKNVNVEEEEEDIITLEFDDDTAVDCYVLGTFELNDKEYIALEPEDGTDDVYIYGYKQISDDERSNLKKNSMQLLLSSTPSWQKNKKTGNLFSTSI